MKKFIIIIIVAFACMAFTAGTLSGERTMSSESEGYIEYSIPNMLTGTISYGNFETIYGLLPYDIRELMVGSYMEIANREEESFRYNDVLVKHAGDDWEFHYKGCWIKVIGVNPDALSELFILSSLM